MINMEALIKGMSVQERMELMNVIWESFDDEVKEEYAKEDEEELNILRERWAEYEANPDDTISMEEFKERWEKRKNDGKKL